MFCNSYYAAWCLSPCHQQACSATPLCSMDLYTHIVTITINNHHLIRVSCTHLGLSCPSFWGLIPQSNQLSVLVWGEGYEVDVENFFHSISWSIFTFFHCFPVMSFSFFFLSHFLFSLSHHLFCLLLGPWGLSLKGGALSWSMTQMSHMTPHVTKSRLHTDISSVYLSLLSNHVITTTCI